MSVRAWFVISALALVALVTAFVLRFFSPVSAPEIVARVGSIRLHGEKTSECWPQRDGKLRCRTYRTDTKDATRLRGSGRIHVGIAFPARPEDGALTLRSSNGATVVSTRWRDWIDYRVEPGSYEFRAVAEYPAGARVDYRFALTVTTSHP